MDESHYLPPNELNTTSTRLLRRVAENDGQAWRQIVAMYGPVVRFWIRKAGVSRNDLADVFQEVFLAVSRNIANFERADGKAKFRAWLKTVTLSKVNDHYRRAGKQPAAIGGSTAQLRLGEIEAASHTTEDGDDGDESLAHSEEAFLAQRTLQLMKQEFRDKTWQAFYHTAVEGRTSQDVAADLGMTPLAVRKAKSRVLQRLKEALNGPMNGDSTNA